MLIFKITNKKSVIGDLIVIVKFTKCLAICNSCILECAALSNRLVKPFCLHVTRHRSIKTHIWWFISSGR